MARGKKSESVILEERSKILDGRQDWQVDTRKNKLTNDEKKVWTRASVEESMAGNPNMRRYKLKIPKFPPPTQSDKERMKKLDDYGNPLPGWKWEGLNIVREKSKKKK